MQYSHHILPICSLATLARTLRSLARYATKNHNSSHNILPMLPKLQYSSHNILPMISKVYYSSHDILPKNSSHNILPTFSKVNNSSHNILPKKSIILPIIFFPQYSSHKQILYNISLNINATGPTKKPFELSNQNTQCIFHAYLTYLA